MGFITQERNEATSYFEKKTSLNYLTRHFVDKQWKTLGREGN